MSPLVQVMKADVDAALSVMNFAIYHKELTDMDEREAEREKEAERKRLAESHSQDIDSNDDNEPENPSTGTRFETLLLWTISSALDMSRFCLFLTRSFCYSQKNTTKWEKE